MRYAGFLRRLAAALIDEMLVGIAAAAISSATVFTFLIEARPGTDPLTATALPFGLIAIALAVIYFTFLDGRYGVTVGKRLMNLKLIRYAQPNRDGIGFLHALGRLAVGGVLRGLFNISFLWALLDPKRRAIHDRVFGTLVVYDPAGSFKPFDPDRFPPTPRQTAWFVALLILSIVAYLLNRVFGVPLPQ